MKKYSEIKLEQYSIIPQDGFELYLKNVAVATHNVNLEAGYYIWDEHRQVRVEGNSVTLYKQIYDAEGELLEQPIYDHDQYYCCNDWDGYREPFILFDATEVQLKAEQ